MRVYANAKINLYLKVLGKNESGYHDLDSLMAPIDLYDVIDIEDSDVDEIIGMDIPMEDNLIYKAVQKVRDEFCLNKKIKIIIKKNIPSFAGLGGGSSDAAFVIKALNEMWNLQMTTEKMLIIANEVGSDVPFFIINKPALISGRGDKVNEVLIDEFQGLLIFDDLKFSTKKVFENMKEYSECYSEDIIKKYIKDNYYSLVCNDLEKGVLVYSESEQIFKQKQLLLDYGAKCASMSGSGSSVFGLFDLKNDALLNKAYDELKPMFKNVWKIKAIFC